MLSSPAGRSVCGDVAGRDRRPGGPVLHLPVLQPVRPGQRSSVWVEPLQEALQPCGRRQRRHVCGISVAPL